MKLTHDVLIDLLSLERAGEASDDSKALLQHYREHDEGFAQLARESESLPAKPVIPVISAFIYSSWMSCQLPVASFQLLSARKSELPAGRARKAVQTVQFSTRSHDRTGQYWRPLPPREVPKLPMLASEIPNRNVFSSRKPLKLKRLKSNVKPQHWMLYTTPARMLVSSRWVTS